MADARQDPAGDFDDEAHGAGYIDRRQPGFGEAYYARPEAFLETDVRAAQSGWVLTDPEAVARGVAKLADDLASGRWDERHGHLRSQRERGGAVRLVVGR